MMGTTGLLPDSSNGLPAPSSSTMTFPLKVLFLTAALGLYVGCDSAGPCDPPDGATIQASAVPAAVRAALDARYPGATVVTWYRENADYEASFTESGRKTSVLITPEGTVTAVEAEIDPADLPAAVRQRIASDYAGYTLTAAARIEDLAGGQTKWEAELERNGQKTDYIFAADGALLDTIPLEAGSCE